MTKWSKKYTFLYLVYIKTAGILFGSTIHPRCFGYPVGKVKFCIKNYPAFPHMIQSMVRTSQ
jgi:hypothetical protein